MTINDSPCMACEKKGCGAYHDKCPEFIAFKEKRDAKKNSVMKKKNFDAEYNSFKINNVINTKRKVTRR